MIIGAATEVQRTSGHPPVTAAFDFIEVFITASVATPPSNTTHPSTTSSSTHH